MEKMQWPGTAKGHEDSNVTQPPVNKASFNGLTTTNDLNAYELSTPSVPTNLEAKRRGSFCA